jgi:hypothetical protein
VSCECLQESMEGDEMIIAFSSILVIKKLVVVDYWLG